MRWHSALRAKHFAHHGDAGAVQLSGHEKAETDSIPQLLVKQVQSSVYMEDTLRRLAELGVDTDIEIGPGTALSGFVKKTLPGNGRSCYPQWRPRNSWMRC